MNQLEIWAGIGIWDIQMVTSQGSANFQKDTGSNRDAML